MTYGYIRVSSDKQTVENQRYEIEKFCRVNNLKVEGWIEETISGTKPPTKQQLDKLLNRMKAGHYCLAEYRDKLLMEQIENSSNITLNFYGPVEQKIAKVENQKVYVGKEEKIDIANVEEMQSEPAKPVEDVDMLFRYIHPSVTDDAERIKIHKEIKNAVTQLSLPDLCRYLMNMEKTRGVIYLSKIKPQPAFDELHRMGMPDVTTDGYTYSNFIKHYNVNK